MARRGRNRDDRDYDSTQLKMSSHGRCLHRDYSAHFFRWSFARRYCAVGDTVLEVGCGQDQPLSKILTGAGGPYVDRYVGVDLNKLKPSGNQRFEFIGGFNFVERWKELKALDGYPFTRVVCLEVIEHMHPRHGLAMLRSINMLMRRDGLLLLSTPVYDGKRHAANHIHEYTVEELGRVLKAAWFEVVDRFGTFMDIKGIRVERGGGGDRELTTDAAATVWRELAKYYDNNALSCFFAPMFPNRSRNNLWICKVHW